MGTRISAVSCGARQAEVDLRIELGAASARARKLHALAGEQDEDPAFGKCSCDRRGWCYPGELRGSGSRDPLKTANPGHNGA